MTTRRPASRSVPLVYGTVAGFLIAIIAALALFFVPPSPPSVAEFAPQAQEEIEDAPLNQSSGFGAGSGGACAPGQNCETSNGGPPVSSARPVLEKTRVRRCVGNPPRQTEDPQSPPCVNYWEGDNGGSTSFGVTGEEVSVAIPCVFSNCNRGTLTPAILAIESHFNRRYELYGRKIHLIPYFAFSTSQATPVQQRAAATRVAEELKAFASLSLYSNSNALFDTRAYQSELSRRKVLGFEPFASLQNADEYQRAQPYQWSVGQSYDSLQRNLGEMACKSLAGRRARHAGPAEQVATRKFGLLIPEGETVSTSVLQSVLSRCDSAPMIERYPIGGTTNDVSARRTMLGSLRTSGVTTLICVCSVITPGGIVTLMGDATATGWQPEWLLSGIYEEDNGVHYKLSGSNTANQRIHMFGIASRNKFRPFADEPWFWAVKESNPDYRVNAGLGTGRDNGNYEQLLVLASGIQLAGPRLTPETFERGLFNARFPNPGAGKAPFWQASVGFGPGDYSFLDDVALTWWDEASRDEHDSNGRFCYIERGARWSPGEWPEKDHDFFDQTQPCR